MNCEICKKVFSGIECFQQHVASERHRKKLSLHNSMSSNSVSAYTLNSTPANQSVNQTNFSCTKCTITFQTFSEFTEHMNSEDHARMILLKKNTESEPMENIDTNSSGSNVDSTTQDFVLNNNLKVTATWQPNCEMCDKTFSGPEPYQQHMSSLRHQKKVLSASNSMVEISKDNTTPKLMGLLQCDICDKTFTGPICYQQHLESEAHKKVLDQRYYLKKFLDKENSSVDSGPDLKHSEKPSPFIPPSAWYCEVCDIQCSGIDPYRQHLASKGHAKKAMRAGADSKQNELKSLFSNETSFDSFNQASSQQGRTEIDSIRSSGNATSGDVGQDVKKSLYGDDWNVKTITSSDLDLTFFAVGEEINFDKNSKIKIEAKVLDMIDVKEEENEEMEE